MQLVTLDLDGTLIETTVFDAAGRGLGYADEIEFFDDLYFRGLISITATFMAEYELFLDHPIDEVQEAMMRGPWLDRIGETVTGLQDRGLEAWVVTDQPDWAVGVLERWGIDEGVFSITRSWGDRIGPVEERVDEKWPPLARRLEERSIDPSQVCHVGNGSNDVPVFEEIGYAIAFNPHGGAVRSAADVVVKSDDLSSILEPIDGWLGKEKGAD